MTETTAERIASSLERIASVLEMLATPTEAPPDEPMPEPTCSHPEDQRLQLGATNGWQCMAPNCGFRQMPSPPSGPGTTIRDRP